MSQVWKPNEEIAGLVRYEREMLDFALNLWLEASAMRESGRHTRSMRVYKEAFLIHYRNLLDFLQPGAQIRDTDITAGPFLGEEASFDAAGTSIEYREAINVRLAHLSSRRLVREEMHQLPEMRIMHQAINEAYHRFLDLLPNSSRSWF